MLRLRGTLNTSRRTNALQGMAYAILAFRVFGAVPRLLLQALAPQLVVILDVQPADIAFVLLGNMLVASMIILIYPVIARYVGIGLLLLIGTSLSAATLAFIAFADSFHILAAVFCIGGGIGWALLGLQCPQHLVANLPPESLLINMRALTVGPLISGLVVPPAVLWASQFIQWQTAVLCLVVMTLVFCLFAVIRVPSRGRFLPTPGEAGRHIAARSMLRVGFAEYAAIALSGGLAGFFALHFVLIVDQAFESPNITAIALFMSGLTTFGSIFLFTRMQESGNLFRSLIVGSMLASAVCMVTAAFYQTWLGLVSLLAWPALSAGYFMYSMSVAASYDKVARVSGRLIIVHMCSAGAGAYLFSLAVQAMGSYLWPLRIVAGFSFCVSLLLVTMTNNRKSSRP